MSLEILIEKRYDGLYTVSLEGRLDSETYMDFQDKIKPYLLNETPGFIFDLCSLDYISSSGLGVFFMVKKFTDEKDKVFLMTNLKPQIKKVFDIVKALPIEAIFQSIEEIDNYLDAMQRKELDKELDKEK